MIHILLTEDDLVAQCFARSMFEMLKCKVTVAATGSEALQCISQDTYNFVLLDLGLPDISGYEVAQRIREGKHNANVPIIALTAHHGKDVEEKCLAIGMDEFLSKPLTTENINSLLARYGS